MISLTPWSSGWANNFLEDGTPIWEDSTFGNAALDNALFANIFEIVSRHFPNSSEEWIHDFSNAWKDRFWGGEFYNASNDFDAPVAFSQLMDLMRVAMEFEPGYTVPTSPAPTSNSSSDGMSPMMILAAVGVAWLAFGRSKT